MSEGPTEIRGLNYDVIIFDDCVTPMENMMRQIKQSTAIVNMLAASMTQRDTFNSTGKKRAKKVKTCLVCPTEHTHNNAFCSAECCEEYKTSSKRLSSNDYPAIAKVGDKVRITASNKELRAVYYGGKAKHDQEHVVTHVDDNDICIDGEETGLKGPFINHGFYEVLD